MTLHELGKYDEAEESLRAALQIYEAHDNQQGIANVLREFADLLYFVRGKPDEAIPHYEESLHAARHARDRTAEILAILNHGCARISLGQYTHAEELLAESLRMSRALEAKRLIGVTLNNLAIIAYDDDPAKAQTLMEENYAIRVEIGDKLGQANCLRHMAQTAGAMGDYAEMVAIAERAGRIYREIDNHRGVISGLTNRAYALANLGQIVAAQENWAWFRSVQT